MGDINKIIEDYNFILTEMPGKRRFYHLKSFNNFLKHFEELKNENDRIKVLLLMGDYIDFVTNNEISSVKECKKVFDDYIDPIGRIYKVRAGFSYFSRPFPVAVYIIITNLILLAFSAPVGFYIGINILGAIVIIHTVRKMKSSRVFSINW